MRFAARRGHSTATSARSRLRGPWSKARQDEALPPEQRAFVYMPFEHAESLPMQDESVRLFERLAAVSPAHVEQLDYARRHRAIVARFGRFPHRNRVLGRESTPEEAAFLLEPGSSF